MTTPATPVRPGGPLLRILRGRPDEDEITAATVALLAALRTRRAPAGASAAPAHDPGTGYRAPGAWTARRRFTYRD
jgi:hypothetical protein